MSMVEHIDDNNGEVIDGDNVNLNIFDTLEVPSVEGDETYWEDFPPMFVDDDDFMGFNPSNINNANKPPTSNHNVPVSIKSEQKEQTDCVVISNNMLNDNGANTSHQDVMSLETNASHPRSPISVLESGGTCLSAKILTVKSEMSIPARARSKRGPPSNGNPWLRNTPIRCAASVAKKSLNGIEEMKSPITTEISNSPEGLKGSLQDLKRFPEDITHTEKKVTSKQRSLGTKRCTHCHVTKTPQWREGPLGKNTLCNACGVRYRSGRLFPEYRPAASPTFTPFLHSNSHRKVIEMRGKAVEETVLVANPMSLFSESVPLNSCLFDDCWPNYYS